MHETRMLLVSSSSQDSSLNAGQRVYLFGSKRVFPVLVSTAQLPVTSDGMMGVLDLLESMVELSLRTEENL